MYTYIIYRSQLNQSTIACLVTTQSLWYSLYKHVVRGVLRLATTFPTNSFSENGGRTMKFHGEVEFGRSLNWRLRDLRFPTRWWSELEFERPWRGLGRWRVPGFGGFGNHGVELVDSDRWRLCFSVRLELEVDSSRLVVYIKTM